METQSRSRVALFVAGGLLLAMCAAAAYLSFPRSLLIQGEADSTRMDMAARVDGRVARIFVVRGDNVAAGAKLLALENPELLAKLAEARAGQAVAEAELAHIHAGTRSEEIDIRRADVERSEANAVLAQETFDRVRALATNEFASAQRLDQVTSSLRVAQRTRDQARLAYQQALAGYTIEEVRMAEAKVVQAKAAVTTLQSLVDQLVVVAPAASQVLDLRIEVGEVVAPGVPLLSLVDLADVWMRFDLREDLSRGLQVGDKFDVRVPALADRVVPVAVKWIAGKGEYAGWRATRATGDFDLRTFAVRAYPVNKIDGLRPGMSAYADWPNRASDRK